MQHTTPNTLNGSSETYTTHTSQLEAADPTRQELQQRIDSLELINQELLRFTYMACHHIQEPLRTVSSLSSILSDKYSAQLDHRGLQSLKHISDAVLKVQTLIKCLLDYGRIGKRMNKELVDTERLIESVKNDLEILINSSRAQVIHHNLPVINGYSTELRKLFQHLITNAIKYRQPHSAPRIIISAKEADDRYIFSIRDNGIGIHKESLEDIFTIFHRLNQSEEAVKGHGMGLANSRKILQIHDGKIWAESTINKGSTFHFSIPIT